MAQLEKIFFNGRFVEPWTEVPEGKLRDKAVAKFVQNHGVKKAILQEYNVQKLNPKFSAKLSRLKNITNWAQTGPSPLNRILPKLFGKAAAKAITIPAVISDVLLGTKLTPGRSDWQLPGFADVDPSTKWYEGWGAEKVFGDKQKKDISFKGVATGPPSQGFQPSPQKDTSFKGVATGPPSQGFQPSPQKDTSFKGVATGPPSQGFQSSPKQTTKKTKSKASRRPTHHYAKGGGVRASKYKL